MKPALLTTLLFTILFPMLTMADDVEDPHYKHWASFKVGSKVTIQVTRTTSQSNKTVATRVLTLKEVTGDYVAIEVVTTSGAEASTKLKKYTRTPDHFKCEDRGQEQITVAGKKLLCHHYASRLYYNDGKLMSVTDGWYHPDIPGAAKMLTALDEATALDVVAVSWEKK